MTVDELEKQYEVQQKKVIALAKLYRMALIGKLYRKKFYEAKTKLHVIFTELRNQTREKYPERFISSEGSI